MRCYANENDEQGEEGQARELGAAALGAHVDGNVLTVLYANGPGLQIPSRDSTITADEVAAFGMPTITGAFLAFRRARRYNLIYTRGACCLH